MEIAAAIAAPLASVWVLANLLGWLITRGGPWNWRVLGGADLYYRWLRRRESWTTP